MHDVEFIPPNEAGDVERRAQIVATASALERHRLDPERAKLVGHTVVTEDRHRA